MDWDWMALDGLGLDGLGWLGIEWIMITGMNNIIKLRNFIINATYHCY
jgi:hypothetical protein